MNWTFYSKYAFCILKYYQSKLSTKNLKTDIRKKYTIEKEAAVQYVPKKTIDIKIKHRNTGNIQL